MSHGVFSPSHAYIATDESASAETNRSAAEKRRKRSAIQASAGRTIANSYWRIRGR